MRRDQEGSFMRIYAFAAVATFMAMPALAQDAVSNAFTLCRLIDGTGLTSSECKVSGLRSSVTTTIDMSATEARDLCFQISGYAVKNGLSFGDWTLNIQSPFSNGNNIALCKLE